MDGSRTFRVTCACGCGKEINKFDSRGRERKFDRECFSPGRKLTSGARTFIRQKALEPDRIEQAIANLKVVNEEVSAGTRKPGGWIDGFLRSREDGYLMVKKPEHPRANNLGYVFLHILVAEEKIGRPLKDEETVHHINCKRMDNQPENLLILPSGGEHQRLHSREDQRRDALGRFAAFLER